MALRNRFSFKARTQNAGPGPNIAVHHESRGVTVVESPRPMTASSLPWYSGRRDDYRVYNLTDDYSAGDAPAHTSGLEWYAERLNEADVDMSISPTVTSNPPRPRTKEAGYDPETGTLRIRFRGGAVYDYDVDPETWEDLQREKTSTGKWMARNGLGGIGSGTRVE